MTVRVRHMVHSKHMPNETFNMDEAHPSQAEPTQAVPPKSIASGWVGLDEVERLLT